MEKTYKVSFEVKAKGIEENVNYVKDFLSQEFMDDTRAGLEEGGAQFCSVEGIEVNNWSVD
ncbi:MAG: hypothetical protein ACTSXD_11660 [Candidatus Heimdallarchaeaceae archaeon]